MKRLSSLPRLLSPPTTAIPTVQPKSLLPLLDSCILHNNLLLASLLHSNIIVSGLEADSVLSTKLITLYSSCQHISLAETVFRRYPLCNAFLLNAMIRGYSSNGLYRQALDLFARKRAQGLEPDSYTFSCVIKACTSLCRGKELHGVAVESGFGSDIFVCNSLIAMYAKCGCLECGTQVFDGMPQRDVVSWNSVISACAVNGLDSEAVEKVREMAGSGLKPDQVTILSTLGIGSIAEDVVKEVHGYVMRSGCESVLVVRNAIVSAYGKCGRMKAAHRVFESTTQKDRVTWNALIACYAQNGLFEESTRLLRDMKLSGLEVDVVTYSGIISSLSRNDQSDEAVAVFKELLSVGLKPDVVAIASILPAISGILCLDCCKQIHGYAYKGGLESDRRVRNALVSVYGKCGSIRDAEEVFDAAENRDVISWSSMVVGYTQNECFPEALRTFRMMVRAKTEPNSITLTSMLSACGGVSGLKLGKELHLWSIKNSLQDQSFVGSALIDMYAKCGRIRDSRRVFDLMKNKNLVTWNSMIGGYAIHGLGENALEIFRMVEEPDEISFVVALSACNHGGLVEEGIKIFNSMKDFNVAPKEAHFACAVDLMARAGRMEEALDLVKTMPMTADAGTWGALLGACKMHSNLDLGILSGERIIALGSGNSGYYVSLSNIFADFGRWGEVEVMRKLMEEKGVKKGAGCSWIEVSKGVHSFVAKERAQHPEWENLFRVLSFLNEQMKGTS